MLFAALFNNTFDFSSLVWIAIAVLGYFAIARFAGPAVAASIVGKLAPRAMNLMRFIDSLGLSVLSPLLMAVGEGRFKDVPAEVMSLFNQLDDKAQRRQILSNLLNAQLKEHLGDPAKREAVLLKIEEQLGVKIPREVTPTP